MTTTSTRTARRRLTIGAAALTAAGTLLLVGGCTGNTSTAAKAPVAAAAVTQAAPAVAAPHDAYFDVIGAPGWGYEASCDTGIRGVDTMTGGQLTGGQFMVTTETAATTYSATFRKGVLILAASRCSDIAPKLALQTVVAPAGYAAPVEQLPISIAGGTGASQIVGMTPSADVHAQYLVALSVTSKGKPVPVTLNSTMSPVRAGVFGVSSGISDPMQIVGYAGPAAVTKYASGTEAVRGVTETLQSTDAAVLAEVTLKNGPKGSTDLPTVVTADGKKLPVVAYREDVTAYPTVPTGSYAFAMFTTGGLLTSVSVHLA